MLKEIIGQKKEAKDEMMPNTQPTRQSAALFAESELERTSSGSEVKEESSSPPLALDHAPAGAAPSAGFRNVFSSETELTGKVQCSGDLLLDGRVEGELVIKGQLTIAENGVINGEVKARCVTVFGTIQGNVNADEICILKSDSTIEGDIAAGSLSVEEGATFIGRSSVGKAAKPAAAVVKSPKKERTTPEVEPQSQPRVVT